MNKYFLIGLGLILSFAVLGQDNNSGNGNNNNQQNMTNSNGARCAADLEKVRVYLGKKKAATGADAAIPIEDPQISTERFQECKSLEKISDWSNGALTDDKDQAASMNQRIICTKKGGYTYDWDACQYAVKTYNAVVVAEAGMNQLQQFQTTQNGKKLQEEASRQVVQGNAQSAAYDAAIANNKHMKQMHAQKAMAYVGAVGALGSAMAKWPKANELNSKCTSVPVPAIDPRYTDPNCIVITGKVATYKNMIFANDAAKGGLVTALTEYVAKGLQAGLAMRQYNNVANQMEAAKPNYQDEENTPGMALCNFNPTAPECVTSGTRVPGAQFQPGEFSMGDGFGNNVFSPGTTDEFGDIGDPSTISDEDRVADVNSPFLDDAKTANGILDPAAAANMQPGSAAPGAGGGAGGGGGGGSASLGDDLQGLDPDANKEANIKTNKVGGNYEFGAGGGFKGVKGGKDENPFASLFDSKTSGGIEEDRSIASDNGGEGSGIFQKISKRYGQVQADKRIEANNLE